MCVCMCEEGAWVLLNVGDKFNFISLHLELSSAAAAGATVLLRLSTQCCPIARFCMKSGIYCMQNLLFFRSIILVDFNSIAVLCFAFA